MAQRYRSMAQFRANPSIARDICIVFLREMCIYVSDCVSKKFPPLNCVQLCQILTDSQNVCDCWKAYEICYKTHMTSNTSHYRDVATIFGKLKLQISADIQPIRKKVQAYCILIASNFVIRLQILIFSVVKNGVSFPILIANKRFHVTVLLVIYFCD